MKRDNDEEEDTSAIDPSSAFGTLKADMNNPWGLDSNTSGDTANWFLYNRMVILENVRIGIVRQ